MLKVLAASDHATSEVQIEYKAGVNKSVVDSELCTCVLGVLWCKANC